MKHKVHKMIGPAYGAAPKAGNESKYYGGMIPVTPFVVKPHQQSVKFTKAAPETAKRQILPPRKLKKY